MLTSRRVVVVGVITCAALAALLLRPAVESDTPPLPIQPSPASWIRESLPPPPPPPPPPIVPGQKPPPSPVLRYAQTAYRVVSDGPAPTRIKEVRPVYPPIAFEYGVEGRVQIDATITASGQVVRAEVSRDGPFYFVQSAIRAIKDWQFAAGDPTRAPARLTVEVTFVR